MLLGGMLALVVVFGGIAALASNLHWHGGGVIVGFAVVCGVLLILLFVVIAVTNRRDARNGNDSHDDQP